MRKGMKFGKKLLSYAMMISIGASLLSGCGKQTVKDENSLINQATKGSKDYVFAQETIDIGLEDTQNLQRIKMAGDRVYTTKNSMDGQCEIYSFNPDGSDIRKITIPLAANENINYFDFDAQGNVYALMAKYGWSTIADEPEEGHEDLGEEVTEGATEGTSDDKDSQDASNNAASEASASETSDEISAEGASEIEESDKVISEEGSDEEEYFLVKYDSTGKEIYKAKLDDSFIPAGSDYVVSTGLVYSEKFGPILSSANQIFSYDENNGFKQLIKSPQAGGMNYYYLTRGFEDQVFVNYYSDKGMVLCSFDPATGNFGKASSVISGYSDFSFFGGNGFDLYYCDNSAIYGYDLTKDEAVKLLDYMDSDLEVTSSISSIVAVSDKEFIAILPDLEYNFSLARLTKVPAEEVVDKKILTLAGSYVNYDIRKKVLEFNKNSNKYKIKIVDYSSLETDTNWNAGAEQLNLDIVSGNTPDMIILSQDLPVDSYINKGLFVDLTSFLDKDPDLSESDFLTNVMDASKTNGKLYQIIPTFSIGTVAMKAKFAQGKNTITFKECTDLIKQVQPNKEFVFGMTNREFFMETGLRYSGEKYIDWDQKKCYFDSDSFIEFLEFANSFPETIRDDAWEDYKDTVYITNEALFQIERIAQFSDYNYLKKILFGEDIALIGFPNDMGENNSTIEPEIRLAICAQSKDKDGAWEFIREFLTQDYQDSLTYNFPIRKTSLDKLGEKAMEKPFYMEDGKKVEYDNTYYLNGVEVVCTPMTKEEVTEFTNFIKELKYIGSYNISVNNIINEEAAAFFSGQKSAKDVADIIQSRLSIYVNENS